MIFLAKMPGLAVMPPCQQGACEALLAFATQSDVPHKVQQPASSVVSAHCSSRREEDVEDTMAHGRDMHTSQL